MTFDPGYTAAVLADRARREQRECRRAMARAIEVLRDPRYSLYAQARAFARIGRMESERRGSGGDLHEKTFQVPKL